MGAFINRSKIVERLVSALILLLVPGVSLSQTRPESFDILIRNGLVYDGTGGAPVQTNIAIRGDRIVAVGKLERFEAKTVIDMAITALPLVIPFRGRIRPLALMIAQRSPLTPDVPIHKR